MGVCRVRVEDAEERERRDDEDGSWYKQMYLGIIIHQMQCEATQSIYKGDESKESFVCRCYYNNDYLK